MSNVNAEIITIGTELLLGELTDTNSVFIARLLRDYGVNVFYITTVGDNRGRIASLVKQALSRSDLVITCGGLGPTVDDMTRQSIADAIGSPLVFHPELLEQIAARFERYRVKMTENNRRQAFLPESADVIENPVGTAPAFRVKYLDSFVIALPGVPREMKFLMTESVVPFIRRQYQLGLIKALTLHTAGIGESTLDAKIGTDLLEHSNPTVGLAAHHGQVDIRITAKADTEAQADQMLAETAAHIYQRVGSYVYGRDDESLETVLFDKLTSVGARVAVATAGISGVLLEVVKRMPKQNLAIHHHVAHPNALCDCDADDLRSVAESTADTLVAETDADLVIVALSLPDVDESPDTETATVVLVKSDEKTRTRVYGFGGRAELASTWVSMWALSAAWAMLTENDNA